MSNLRAKSARPCACSRVLLLLGALCASCGQPNVHLTVLSTGEGTGELAVNPPGVSCGSGCWSYERGTAVEVMQSASSGSLFLAWEGDCSGDGPCALTMDADRTVTANFGRASRQLTVSRSGAGQGAVTSSPSGLDCGSSCSARFPYGTYVWLSPVPAAGSAFSGWSGDCTGMGSCAVTLDVDRNVTALFERLSYQLTLVVEGNGTGLVTSAPAGIECGPTCAARFEPGAKVLLTAAPSADSVFAGWSVAECGSSKSCALTSAANRTVVARFGAKPNIMFVTSTGYSGNLGGLAGADTACQARAQAAGHAGTYRAWLSTTTVNAIDRLSGAAGWMRVDGRPLAASASDVGHGKLLYPPRLDELGMDVGADTARTATTVGGVLATESDCGAWTNPSASLWVVAGNPAGSSTLFSVSGSVHCNDQRRIYCFGVDKSVAMTLPPAPDDARRAFMTSWAPGGGLASADAECSKQARDAGLPGSFKALLATSQASALSRFDLSRAPWYRVDQARVLPSAADWATASYFDTAPNTSADGQTFYSSQVVWTGSTALTAQGNVGSTCSDWTNTGQAGRGGVAGTTRVEAFWSYWPDHKCSFGGGLVTCLQE